LVPYKIMLLPAFLFGILYTESQCRNVLNSSLLGQLYKGFQDKTFYSNSHISQPAPHKAFTHVGGSVGGSPTTWPSFIQTLAKPTPVLCPTVRCMLQQRRMLQLCPTSCPILCPTLHRMLQHRMLRKSRALAEVVAYPLSISLLSLVQVAVCQLLTRPCNNAKHRRALRKARAPMRNKKAPPIHRPRHMRIHSHHTLQKQEPITSMSMTLLTATIAWASTVTSVTPVTANKETSPDRFQ